MLHIVDEPELFDNVKNTERSPRTQSCWHLSFCKDLTPQLQVKGQCGILASRNWEKGLNSSNLPLSWQLMVPLNDFKEFSASPRIALEIKGV